MLNREVNWCRFHATPGANILGRFRIMVIVSRNNTTCRNLVEFIINIKIDLIFGPVNCVNMKPIFYSFHYILSCID